jgi:hypothetical protein
MPEACATFHPLGKSRAQGKPGARCTRVLKSARFYAGTGAARTIGTGLKVKAIRKAPSPMIHEPI